MFIFDKFKNDRINLQDEIKIYKKFFRRPDSRSQTKVIESGACLKAKLWAVACSGKFSHYYQVTSLWQAVRDVEAMIDAAIKCTRAVSTLLA
jgi:hypothetical protein